jgi:hypothetical protein
MFIHHAVGIPFEPVACSEHRSGEGGGFLTLCRLRSESGDERGDIDLRIPTVRDIGDNVSQSDLVKPVAIEFSSNVAERRQRPRMPDLKLLALGEGKPCHQPVRQADFIVGQEIIRSPVKRGQKRSSMRDKFHSRARAKPFGPCNRTILMHEDHRFAIGFDR